MAMEGSLLRSRFLWCHLRLPESMVGGLTVFGYRAHTLTLKENLINISWKLNSCRIQSYLWKFLKSQCRSDKKKEIHRNTALPKLQFASAREMFSRTSPSEIKSAIFQMWFSWFFLVQNLLKFDLIVNADVPFYKRGHNFETEEKLNKVRHPFSNEVSLSILRCRFSVNSAGRSK